MKLYHNLYWRNNAMIVIMILGILFYEAFKDQSSIIDQIIKYDRHVVTDFRTTNEIAVIEYLVINLKMDSAVIRGPSLIHSLLLNSHALFSGTGCI